MIPEKSIVPILPVLLRLYIRAKTTNASGRGAWRGKLIMISSGRLHPTSGIVPKEYSNRSISNHAAQFPDHAHAKYLSVNCSGVESNGETSSLADCPSTTGLRALGYFRPRVGAAISHCIASCC